MSRYNDYSRTSFWENGVCVDEFYYVNEILDISSEEKHLRSLRTMTPRTYEKLKAKEELIK